MDEIISAKVKVGSETPKEQTASIAKIEFTNAANMEVSKIMYNMSEPNEIVTKFVDFSSKYGMGYKLSNGTYGVLFNDSTKIVLDSNLFHFDYF